MIRLPRARNVAYLSWTNHRGEIGTTLVFLHTSDLVNASKLEHFLRSICALLFVVTAATNLWATPITYVGPTLGPGGMTGWEDFANGGTVWYGGVTEANDEAAGGGTQSLFGAPDDINGNVIEFDPINFEAEVTSTGGFVSDVVDSTLSFMILAIGNNVIDNVTFTEAGDTTLAGLPDSLGTSSSVTMTLFIDVLEIDGVPVSEPINIQDAMTFTPSGGSFNMDEDNGQAYDLNGNGFGFGAIWNGLVDVDIDAELTAQNVPFQFGATKLGVSFDNTLSVTAIDGGTAFIKKKDFDGLTVTTDVSPLIPEPATALLAAIAMASFAGIRRV